MITKVISLKRSIDRREFIRNQFLKLNLSFDFEDAIDPKSSPDEILCNFSISNFKIRYGREPITGEIGSILSHYLLLKKFLQKKEQKTMMVLEDDAQIVCTKEELLSVINIFEKSNFDILILGFTKCDNDYENHTNIINPILPIYNIQNKIFLGPRYFHSFCGAVGYLVNRKSAKKMSKLLPTSLLADDWEYFYKLGLNIAYSKPMIIRENWTDVSSTMSHTNKSWTYKKSNYFIISFLLNFRKRLYGLVRILILLIKHKIKF
tara:strand:- start:29 stop:817 length:789 start_codon:yes stop_codon:yes gene_type:complete